MLSEPINYTMDRPPLLSTYQVQKSDRREGVCVRNILSFTFLDIEFENNLYRMTSLTLQIGMATKFVPAGIHPNPSRS